MSADEIRVEARVFEKVIIKSEKIGKESDCQNIMSVLFYRAFSELLDVSYPWGILYGVRPARFWHSLSDKYSKERARNIFEQKYLVSPKSLIWWLALPKTKIKSFRFRKKQLFTLCFRSVLPHKVLVLFFCVAQYRKGCGTC